MLTINFHRKKYATQVERTIWFGVEMEKEMEKNENDKNQLNICILQGY